MHSNPSILSVESHFVKLNAQGWEPQQQECLCRLVGGDTWLSESSTVGTVKVVTERCHFAGGKFEGGALSTHLMGPPRNA